MWRPNLRASTCADPMYMPAVPCVMRCSIVSPFWVPPMYERTPERHLAAACARAPATADAASDPTIIGCFDPTWGFNCNHRLVDAADVHATPTDPRTTHRHPVGASMMMLHKS